MTQRVRGLGWCWSLGGCKKLGGCKGLGWGSNLGCEGQLYRGLGGDRNMGWCKSLGSDNSLHLGWGRSLGGDISRGGGRILEWDRRLEEDRGLGGAGIWGDKSREGTKGRALDLGTGA